MSLTMSQDAAFPVNAILTKQEMEEEEEEDIQVDVETEEEVSKSSFLSSGSFISSSPAPMSSSPFHSQPPIFDSKDFLTSSPIKAPPSPNRTSSPAHTVSNPASVETVHLHSPDDDSNKGSLQSSPPPSRSVHSPDRPSAVSRFSIADILDPEFGAKKQSSSPPSSPASPSYFRPYVCGAAAGAGGGGSATTPPTGFSVYSLHVAPTNPPRQHPSPTRPEPRKARLFPSAGPTSTSSASRPEETASPGKKAATSGNPGALWPAWVYCTRYSDRPSSGKRPRSRKLKRKEEAVDDKRPRTAFTSEQLASLKREFDDNRYLTEERRQRLAVELKLTESQVKIWFQNKRAKMKKSTGMRNPLALQLMAQGLYNHSTVPLTTDEED